MKASKRNEKRDDLIINMIEEDPNITCRKIANLLRPKISHQRVHQLIFRLRMEGRL